LGFDYESFLPDSIAELDVPIPADISAVIGEAEAAVRKLNTSASAVEGSEVLARQLLRAESVGSSKIEGLAISHRRLAHALFRPEGARQNARLVVANVLAMERAIEQGAANDPFTADGIVAIHRTLFEGTESKAYAGVIRDKQNWIGGADWGPHNADYIPPPEDAVRPLLEDLCGFMNRDDLPPAYQAAIAHAQFESIHPFPDGNGRVGRCLIHAILRRRDLTEGFAPPVSVVLAANARTYIYGLRRFGESNEGLNEWAGSFSSSLHTAAVRASDFADDIASLRTAWLERAGSPRARSTARRLIEALPMYPVVDVAFVARDLNVSRQAANAAVSQLERSGVLTAPNTGKWGRAFEARELFSALDRFERDLASPTDGSRRRPVPR
jgi:Fic family protein